MLVKNLLKLLVQLIAFGEQVVQLNLAQYIPKGEWYTTPITERKVEMDGTSSLKSRRVGKRYTEICDELESIIDSQKIINWGVPNLDCITTFSKKA